MIRQNYYNKYPSKKTIQGQNQHLDYLTDPIFQGVNIILVLSFANNELEQDPQDIFFRKQKSR